MPGFTYESETWTRKVPLKYEVGDEKAKDIVIDYTTVSLTGSRRILPAGSLVTKISASGKYGPYDKTETDGRESVAEGSAFFTRSAVDATLMDQATGGWFFDCVFDKSELTMNGLSLHGTSLTTLVAAFPQCTFDD